MGPPVQASISSQRSNGCAELEFYAVLGMLLILLIIASPVDTGVHRSTELSIDAWLLAKTNTPSTIRQILEVCDL